MTITSALSASTAGLTGNSTAANQATTATSSTSPLLTKADQRLQLDANATTAQLSKFGLLKSALSTGQTAAQALSKLSASATPSDVTTALGTFFKTVNASVGAANTAAGAAGSSAASARRVVSDLKAALRSDPATTDALKKLGLTVQSDGSLLQDAKKFATALASDPAGVRAALATVGKKVDAVSSKELASSGSVGAALSSLNQHSSVLAAQQKALQSLSLALTASSTATSTPSSMANSLLNSGLAAYQSNQAGY
jgi:hypothetical protein